MQIKFLKSATELKDCPQDKVSEVVVVGRSNSGKSSLLNALSGQKHLAKVSAAPGKTRLINFFEVRDGYRLVDLPGYGYAARSKEEREDWRRMIESFLRTRTNLTGALLLMDIRRDWTEDESNLVHWNQSVSLPMILILTKADKLNRSELEKRTKAIKADIKSLSLSQDGFPILVVSSTKRTGLDDVGKAIHQNFMNIN